MDDWGSIVGRGRDFILATTYRPAVECTQPYLQWVPGALHLGVKWQMRENHLHLVPRLRMRGPVSPFPIRPTSLQELRTNPVENKLAQ
jgi:hypothetical protein